MARKWEYLNIKHYLEKHQQTRVYRLLKSKKQESKLQRNSKFHAKLKEYTSEVKKAVAKRDGVYEHGIGMDGGYEEGAMAIAAAAAGSEKKCSACGELGHKMRTSKKCRYYKARGGAAAASAAPVLEEDATTTATLPNRDAEEQALLDEMAFESDDEFFDAIEDDFEGYLI